MLPYFSLTLFVSALLLFLVQPMIGKMLLPSLGGTPAVWNTCMVFFQAMLLAGYAYTHQLSTTQPRRRQLLIQSSLLFTPFIFMILPFTLNDWHPPTETNPIFAVFWKLLILVGLPFLIVSTSAPLLQKWFAYTGHPASKDPYFLYGASNLGSMLALILYPIVIEPYFNLAEQAQLWTVGYGILVILMLGCVAILWQIQAPKTLTSLGTQSPLNDDALASSIKPYQSVAFQSQASEAKLTWLRRLRWIGLAAAPSSLMLGVTSHITTDIAAVPMFWVVPLALYLLTFILVFARWPVVWTSIPHLLALYLQPCLLLLLSLQILAHLTPRYWPVTTIFMLHIVTFFVTALVCHGELAADRPSSRNLTEFYLWMSVGGVVGGLFNALFAPLVFQVGIYEYPIALIFGYLLRPNLVGEKALIPADSSSKRASYLGLALTLIIPIGLMIFITKLLPMTYRIDSTMTRSMLLGSVVVVIFTMLNRPLRFGLSLASLFLAVTMSDRSYWSDSYVFEGRDFFSLVRVRESVLESRPNFKAYAGLMMVQDPYANAALTHQAWKEYRKIWTYRTLIHGGIEHGSQIVDPIAERRRPITYFHPTNGVNHIFHLFAWSDARFPASLLGQLDPLGMLVTMHSEPPYAVVGLGTGALASHARPYQRVDFFEIAPIVKRMSLPTDGEEPIFYYLHDALARGANLNVFMGDGRLQIAKQGPKNYYHAISLDAFSSDAIPVHLLTAEAVDMYLDKLVEGGVLIFNVTNRYVKLPGVLAAIAESRDLECLLCSDEPDDLDSEKSAADWVILQRKAHKGQGFANGCPPILEDLNPIFWKHVEPLQGPIWTDHYSNLFRVFHTR